MHLQVRSSIQASGGSLGAALFDQDVIDEAPIEARIGGLHRLLTLLAENGFDLRIASGRNIETAGEFIFAVGPKNGDDDEHERLTRAAVQLLLENRYPARIVQTYHFDVSDAVGQLDSVIARLPKNEAVHEIFVGTPNDDASIPLQITTIRVNQG
jgi:hypothetical protein